MSPVVIAIFILFVVAVLAVGRWKSRGKGADGERDYFLAGRGLTWWLIGFSLIAAVAFTIVLAVRAPVIAPAPRQSPGPSSYTNTIGMKLALIPEGEFMMGSPADEKNRLMCEGPQHRVRITRPFYLCTTEVTQGQWETVMGTRPWHGDKDVKEGSDYPATHVGWEDAVDFCKKLSSKEGKTYRLPSEAEWEYACRSGTTTAYSFGDEAEGLGDYAWYRGNAAAVGENYAHRVGKKKPNGFGLYDMHGNVWEWCSDCYSEEYYESSPSSDPTGLNDGWRRVVRGGGRGFTAGICRSAFRAGDSPDAESDLLGFRIACSSAE